MRTELQHITSTLFTSDFRQQRRLTVVLMTAGVYLVCAAILLYGALTGIFAAGSAKILATTCAATPIVLFAVIRSGLNLRFAEPSLALPQALFAQTLIAISYAVTGPMHASTLILFATVMVFGMFEVTSDKVWKLMAYSIFVAGTVMVISSRNDPVAYPAVLECFYFAMTAAILPSISLLSIQLRRMRERLHKQKAELEEALLQLRKVATHDELTGLPNRRHMLTLLAEHTERQRRGGPDFMVALADMDHFKNVNDTFGHRVGDEALVCFAKQARLHLRTTDIVGRWGGEEFLIILPASAPSDPNIGIERLRGALAVTEVSKAAPHLRICFSTGIARFMAGEGIDDLIERADRALYGAKNAGRNQTVTL